MNEANAEVRIEKIKGGRSGIAVIVHDDGSVGTCEYLKPEAEKNDICFTVALITKKIIDPETGTPDPEAIAFWQSLLDTGRFGISPHSRTHKFWGLTDEDEEGFYVYHATPEGQKTPYSVKKGQITREIAGSKEDVERAFPGLPVHAFVKPGFGVHENGVQLSETAKRIIAENYALMRNTSGGVDTVPPENPHDVKALMVRSGDDPQKWIDALDEAAEKNGVIVYVFHSIKEEEDGFITVSRRNASVFFEAAGKRKKEGLLWITTLERMTQYTESFKTSKAVLTPTADGFEVSLTDPFHGKDYTEPLTLCVSLPSADAIRHASVDYTVAREEGKEGDLIRFDLVPNGEAAVFTLK